MSNDKSHKLRGLDFNKSSFNRGSKLKVACFKIQKHKLCEIFIKMEGKF